MNGLPECVFYSNGFCRNCGCLISVSLLGQLRRKWSYYKQNTWLQTSPQSFSGCWYETLVDSSLHILWFSPEMVNVNSGRVYIYIHTHTLMVYHIYTTNLFFFKIGTIHIEVNIEKKKIFLQFPDGVAYFSSPWMNSVCSFWDQQKLRHWWASSVFTMTSISYYSRINHKAIYTYL